MPPDFRFERLQRHAPLAAALLAAGAALPGLWLPFLADDWGLLADAARGSLARTPFGYFRPLTTLTFRAELSLWGPRPLLFHLTNLLLAAACALLLVVVLRRLTGEWVLAAAAGAAFALHPYHVENVWWVAGRADLLACLLLLAAMLAYDRWRSSRRGLPGGAILLFASALLAKEAAISFPFLILLLGVACPSRRMGREEFVSGFLPMGALALLHGGVVRPVFLGKAAFAQLEGTASHWAGNLFAFVAGSLLPLHTEFLEGRPFLYGTIALGLVGLASASAMQRPRSILRAALVASAAFLILLGPSLLSFQERYLCLPSAAFAVLLVLIGRGLPGRSRPILVSGLACLWLGSLAWHAIAWNDAGRTSGRLVRDLRDASLAPGIGGILVANMPHRIHGVAVAANFQEAVVLSGGRKMPIKTATALDFPSSGQDGLVGGFPGALTRSSDRLVVRLEVPARRFSRVVLPLPGKSVAKDPAGEWEVAVEGGGSLLVKFPLPARSVLHVWTADGLRSLEGS